MTSVVQKLLIEESSILAQAQAKQAKPHTNGMGRTAIKMQEAQPASSRLWNVGRVALVAAAVIASGAGFLSQRNASGTSQGLSPQRNTTETCPLFPPHTNATEMCPVVPFKINEIESPTSIVSPISLESPTTPIASPAIQREAAVERFIHFNQQSKAAAETAEAHRKQKINELLSNSNISPKPEYYLSLTSEDGFKGIDQETLAKLYGKGEMRYNSLITIEEQRDFYNQWAKAISVQGAKALAREGENPTKVARAACESRHALRLYTRDIGSSVSKSFAEGLDYWRSGDKTGLTCDQIFKKYEDKGVPPAELAAKVVEKAGETNDAVTGAVKVVDSIWRFVAYGQV